VAKASSAAALGRDDTADQRTLDGKRFEVRIRFGCRDLDGQLTPRAGPLEALASGVPLVASPRAGGAEVVADGCGAVIDPDDAGALAQALSRLREGDRAGQARAARAAAEPYTYARQVAAFERIYRSARASR
jgi:glycosyltransferase involved in cell wall biosynthesis